MFFLPPQSLTVRALSNEAAAVLSLLSTFVLSNAVLVAGWGGGEPVLAVPLFRLAGLCCVAGGVA